MGIDAEISWLNQDLLLFPQRAFDFQNAGTVVIDQDVADVGTVVWDAETILAHFLDQASGLRLRGKRVLELGAGTGLAGIVAARLGAEVTLTEQAKLLPALAANANSNLPRWGTDTGHHECNIATPGEGNRPFKKARTRTKKGTEVEKQLGPGKVMGDGSESGTCEGQKKGYTESDAPEAMSLSRPLSTEASQSSCPPVASSCPEGFGAGAGLKSSKGKDGEECGVDADKESTGHIITSSSSVSVTELLFSEDVEGVQASMAALSGGGGQFDLIMGADIVYLEGLWDGMAATIKALLRPGGMVLMSFEQRRRNILPFFMGESRFPQSKWECREISFLEDDDKLGIWAEAFEQTGTERRIETMMAEVVDCDKDVKAGTTCQDVDKKKAESAVHQAPGVEGASVDSIDQDLGAVEAGEKRGGIGNVEGQFTVVGKEVVAPDSVVGFGNEWSDRRKRELARAAEISKVRMFRIAPKGNDLEGSGGGCL
ncbi:unnamed protein product [Choristocarpus tenellus]